MVQTINLRSGGCHYILSRPHWILQIIVLFSVDKCTLYELTERSCQEHESTLAPPFFVAAAAQIRRPLAHPHRRRLLFESSLKRHYDKSSGDIGESVDDDGGDDDCVFYRPYTSPTRTVLDFDSDKFYRYYQLCPNRSMRQIRVKLSSISSDPEVDLLSFGNIDFNVAENYNLGSYVSTQLLNQWDEKEREHGRVGKGEQSSQKIDYYVGGDMCDVSFKEETGSIMRTKGTKVIHEDQCCWHVSDFDGSLHSQDQNHQSQTQFRIMDVERSECAYAVRLCTICTIDDGNLNGGHEINEVFRVGIDHKHTNHHTDHEDYPQRLDLMDIYLQTSTDNHISNNQDHLKNGLQNVDPVSFPPIPPSKIASNRDLIKSMFRHAYDAYMYNAYPASELKPISCSPGSFKLVQLPALTLIDSLDTLIIMGNHTEFARGVERLRFLDKQMNKSKVWEKDNDPRNNRNPHPILDGFNGIAGGLFAVNQNVSLFETNIRVLGGLLSAHQMAMVWMNDTALVEDIINEDGSVSIGAVQTNRNRGKAGNKACKQNSAQFRNRKTLNKQEGQLSFEPILSEMCDKYDAAQICEGSFKNLTKIYNEETQSRIKVCTPSAYWKYDGILLTLAHDMGRRLLPAFNTKTGIPYGTVNLLYGVPHGETTVASLAGAGTLSIEMELLSRLTGDVSFGKAAKLATRALWTRRSSLNLVGKHIDIHTGAWMEYLSGIGSNSDSFYEYLIKHYILFPEDEEFWVMFQNMYSGIFNKARYVALNICVGSKQDCFFQFLNHVGYYMFLDSGTGM